VDTDVLWSLFDRSGSPSFEFRSRILLGNVVLDLGCAAGFLLGGVRPPFSRVELWVSW